MRDSGTDKTPEENMSLVCWGRGGAGGRIVIIQPLLTSHKHFI